MNVLGMGRMLQAQVGSSADLPWAGPSTFNGTGGQYLEFFNWLRMAYKRIQTSQMEWNWRTQQGTLQLAAISATGAITATQATLNVSPSTIFTASMVGANIRVNGAGPAGAVLTTTIATVTDSSHVTLATTASTTVSAANVAVAGKYVFPVADIQKQTGGLIQAPIITTQTTGPTDLSNYEDAVHLHFIDDQRYGLVWDLNIGVADQTFCRFIPYQDWRGWKDRNVLPASKPAFYTRRPDLSLEFNPIPNQPTYCFSFDYKTVLDDFPNTNDVGNASTDNYSPLYLPAQFHEAVVWRAVMYWAQKAQNPAKWDVAQTNFKGVMTELAAQYLPEINFYMAEFYGGY